jgi:hypothetical protein
MEKRSFPIRFGGIEIGSQSDDQFDEPNAFAQFSDNSHVKRSVLAFRKVMMNLI